MSIVWPNSLVREIAERRCIFFLGSGVSASASAQDGTHPKTWREFLTSAVELVQEVPIKQQIKELLEDNRLLLALQAIRAAADGAEYHELLDRNFLAPQFRPSSLHEVILNLDSRLVITTNFDKIYESLCLSDSEVGYKIISYESSSLADEIRSNTRLIIKAHGSIDNYHSMIFTRAQYNDMKRNNFRFYEVLKALFLTNTVIFIGCGMQDPDVMLLLEDVAITGANNRPHYALIKQDEHNPLSIQDWQDTYKIKCLQYGPEHTNLTEDLGELLALVEEYRKKSVG